MRIETKAVHAGRHIDPATGAVTPPVHLSTTFERDPSGDYPLGFSYSRDQNPNRKALEECLAALEGGKEALAFSSGLAVATALWQSLEPGDHVIAAQDVYWALRKMVGDVFGKWPIETNWVDLTDLDAVRAALRPTTRMIWIETPSNPLLKIVDLRAIAKMAREQKNAITVCDNTFATPLWQRPLECGIDLVMHSTTKFLGGHSDVVGGALVTRFDNWLFERARKSQRYAGLVPSPFDCWLTLRGVSTLAVRVRAATTNAERLARFLLKHPSIERVHWPGLADHPGHEIAAGQMSGFGAMLSFEVRGGREAAIRAAAKVRLFTRATSLGGVHSLIEHRASVEGPQTRTPPSLLRVSLGIENVDDLIEDMEQALA